MKKTSNSISVLLLVIATHVFFISSCALKVGQTCGADRNCDQGLQCGTCVANGNVRPRCTRNQPISPTSKAKGRLPFNNYSWLTTHNSFALYAQKSPIAGSVILAPTNQQDSITDQLKELDSEKARLADYIDVV